MSDASKVIFGFFDAMAKVATIPRVYPGYIAFHIKRGLLAKTDPEQIIRSIGDVETLGDCRYALTLLDFNNTKYRITVEVAKP